MDVQGWEHVVRHNARVRAAAAGTDRRRVIYRVHFFPPPLPVQNRKHISLTIFERAAVGFFGRHDP